MINGSFAHYQLYVEPGTYDGKSVDEFKIVKARTDQLVARFLCEKDNYNRIYLTKVFNVDQGELYYTAKRAGFDENDWPWYWFSGEEDRTGKWIEQTRWFCNVDLNPTFDNETFGFNPPNDFSISDMSSGKTVIERYRKIAGKRQGPEDIIWDDGVDRSPSGAIRMEQVVQAAFLILLATILPLLLWVRHRRDSS